MTGPEHYAEGERLLELADHCVSENYVHQTGEHKADVIAMAQAHFTAALVAATVYAVPGSTTSWDDALGVTDPNGGRLVDLGPM